MRAFSRLHQDLATANRHIAEGQAQIAQQAKLVGKLAADGDDATSARHLLMFMQRNLAIMNAHRQQIVRELSRGPGKRL
jgi:hypothetical protein